MLRRSLTAASGRHLISEVLVALGEAQCAHSIRMLDFYDGANGEGRTPMALRPLEPKSSASASSATFAALLALYGPLSRCRHFPGGWLRNDEPR